MAHVNCPKCGERLNLPPIQETRGVRCPACKHEFTVSPPSQPQPLPGDYTSEGTGVFAKTSIARIASIVIWTFLCMLVMGSMIQYYPYVSRDPVSMLKNAPFVAAYGTVPFLISLLPVVCIRPRNNWVGFAIAAAGGVFIGLASQTYSSTTGSIVNGILVGLVPGTYWVSLFAITRYNADDVQAEEGRRESQGTPAASLHRRAPSTDEAAIKDSTCPQAPRLRKPSNRKDGRTMMSVRKAILLIGGSIIVVMCAIPPWHAQVNVSRSQYFRSVSHRTWTQAGYRPIADPKGYLFKTSDIEKYNMVYQYRIAMTQLIVQVLGVAVATGVLVVVSGQRRKRDDGSVAAKGADDLETRGKQR